jgi:DNA-directed RNA polymerase specialized sigma24 family protein
MAPQSSQDPDTAAVIDVRSALMRLPPRRRACLVLRHCFELTEHDVAEALGISVGTVKSQTSKAVAQFRRELADVTAVQGSAVPDTLEPDVVAASRRRRPNDGG